MSIKDNYENGECPDCGDPIPDDIVDGGECSNCGHVFYEEMKNDDKDTEEEPDMKINKITTGFVIQTYDTQDRPLRRSRVRGGR